MNIILYYSEHWRDQPCVLRILYIPIYIIIYIILTQLILFYLNYVFEFENVLVTVVLSTKRCVVSNSVRGVYSAPVLSRPRIMSRSSLMLQMQTLYLPPSGAAVRAGVVPPPPVYRGNDVFVEHETIALLRRCCSRRQLI